MTNYTNTTRGAGAATLLAALAIAPIILSSCGGLNKSDRETIDIPPVAPVGASVVLPTGGVGGLAEAPSTGTPIPMPVEIKEPGPPPYSLEDAEKYVIQAGDALSVIAAQYGVSTSDVMRANKITNANKIRAGQTLLVPGKEADAAAPEETAAPEPTTPEPADVTEPKLPSISGDE
jgi:LysM repeat protein